jgi:hypothetical protein
MRFHDGLVIIDPHVAYRGCKARPTATGQNRPMGEGRHRSDPSQRKVMVRGSRNRRYRTKRATVRSRDFVRIGGPELATNSLPGTSRKILVST